MSNPDVYIIDISDTDIDEDPQNDLQKTCTSSNSLFKNSLRDGTTKKNANEGHVLIESDQMNEDQEIPEPPPKYTHKSSAYLQHLAEICFTILNDLRWNNRLFAWEHGDDLSAVHAIAKLYENTNNNDPKKPLDVDENINDKSDTNTKSNYPGNNEKRSFDRGNDDDARVMHLYCRIFHRRGPWFRLDDLFVRYYLNNTNYISIDNKISEEKNDDESTTELNEQKKIENPDNKSKTTSECGSISISDAVKLFFKDIHRLISMGLIRTFENEKECGTVVGNDRMNGGVLTNQERSVILNKLGVKKSNLKHGKNSGKRYHPNEILRQMTSQRSVMDSFFSVNTSKRKSNDSGKDRKTKILLPVRNHVCSLILDELCRRCNNHPEQLTQYSISSRDLKKMWQEVNEINYCSRTYNKSQASETLSSPYPPVCIRMREKPLKVIRRFVRLYMIASGGSGNMRQGAWLSVIEDEDKDQDDFLSSDSPSKEQDAQRIKNIHLVSEENLPFSIERASWHKLTYPGLWHRIKKQEFTFLSHYEPLLSISNRRLDADNIASYSNSQHNTHVAKSKQDYLKKNIHMARVFRCGRPEFLKWEISVEVRSQMDYLLGKNDLSHWLVRQKSKTRAANKTDMSLDEKDDGQSLDQDNNNQTPMLELKDRLNLQSRNGRLEMIQRFLIRDESKFDEGILRRDLLLVKLIEETVDTIVSELFGGHPKKSEYEAKDLIMILCIILSLILRVRAHVIMQNEVEMLLQRPWLRHLQWEAVLAVVIWDGIPIFEKSGHHGIAVFLIETILFGGACFHLEATSLDRESEADGTTIGMVDQAFFKFQQHLNRILSEQMRIIRLRFMNLLLSRRTRGKALERLLIDRVHFQRKNKKEEAFQSNKDKPKKRKNPKKEKGSKVSIEKADSQILCEKIIQEEGTRASIPFSTLRNLAKRLKCPLVDTMKDVWNCEMIELNIRLANSSLSKSPTQSSSDEKKSSKSEKESKVKHSYCDWTPDTDHSVAHSTKSELGGRCSFVGWEEENQNNITHRSLNVEELALEEYASGRLPKEHMKEELDNSGGWIGWHDEGGHVRALFRIMCTLNLLGFKHDPFSKYACEDWTVFLTPYQAAPLDLHVGYFYTTISHERKVNRKEKENHITVAVRSFYERRRAIMETYFQELICMKEQDICQIIHEIIQERIVAFEENKGADISLSRDLDELRTLSMIACGLGGQRLAAIFRCLAFDYRHYSGGLPDLLLAKVTFVTSNAISKEDAHGNGKNLVPLNAWVGEAFQNFDLHLGRVSDLSKLLVDRDDEFLGCEKSSDAPKLTRPSQGRYNSNKMNQLGNSRKDNQTQEEDNNVAFQNAFHLAKPLTMTFQNKKVSVHCMFVEVKSSNDRLDARQEDWLNVLDGVGLARVCKFDNAKKKG